MYICLFCLCIYDISIRFWNFSDSVMLFGIFKYNFVNYHVIVNIVFFTIPIAVYAIIVCQNVVQITTYTKLLYIIKCV